MPSLKPAWPMCPVVLAPPVKWDALHCSLDNRIRVATIGREFFVSVDGDNFAGPFKSAELATAYGESIKPAASVARAAGAALEAAYPFGYSSKESAP